MEAIEAATHAQAPAGNVYGLGAETPSRRRVTDDVFDMGACAVEVVTHSLCSSTSSHPPRARALQEKNELAAGSYHANLFREEIGFAMAVRIALRAAKLAQPRASSHSPAAA